MQHQIDALKDEILWLITMFNCSSGATQQEIEEEINELKRRMAMLKSQARSKVYAVPERMAEVEI